MKPFRTTRHHSWRPLLVAGLVCTIGTLTGVHAARAAEPAGEPAAEPADAEPADAETESSRPESGEWFLMPRLTAVLGFAPLIGALSPGLQFRKGQKTDNILTNNTYMQAGIDVPFNPTMVVFRPSFEIMPLAILRLQVAYWGMGFTGLDLNGGHTLTVDTPESPSNKAAWTARAGEGTPRFVHRFTLNVLLRAAIGPVAVITETEAALWVVPRISGDGNYMFNGIYDSLIRVGQPDGSIMNRSLLLFYAWKSSREASVLVGVVNEYYQTFDAGQVRDRLGAAVVVNIGEEIDEVQRMQIALLGGINLIDKNYQYDPYFQLVIRMAWDIKL